MNKMLPQKYIQQINYFELSIADPHKSVPTLTQVMFHGLMLFPLDSSLRHRPPVQNNCSINQSCLSRALSQVQRMGVRAARHQQTQCGGYCAGTG